LLGARAVKQRDMLSRKKSGQEAEKWGGTLPVDAGQRGPHQ